MITKNHQRQTQIPLLPIISLNYKIDSSICILQQPTLLIFTHRYHNLFFVTTHFQNLQKKIFSYSLKKKCAPSKSKTNNHTKNYKNAIIYIILFWIDIDYKTWKLTKSFHTWDLYMHKFYNVGVFKSISISTIFD